MGAVSLQVGTWKVPMHDRLVLDILQSGPMCLCWGEGRAHWRGGCLAAMWGQP